MDFSVEKIKPIEYEELYEVLAVAFEKTPWDYFRPFYENDPWMKDDFVFVIRDNGKIVSSVTVFDRTVWIEGKRVKMGGIGNVGTLPSFRGKGLAGLILDKCRELMKKEGFDVSLLFAGPVPLYEKHGWSSLKVFSYVFSDFKEIKVDPLITVRPISWEKERFIVRQIHSEFIKQVNFATERNMVYWNSYVRMFKNKNCDLFGAFKKNLCVAYLFVDFDRKEKNLWLKELCWKDKEDLLSIIKGIIDIYKPEKIKLTGTGTANPVIDVLKEVSDNVYSDHQKGFMACNINANFDMKSDSFCDKILHFSGDDF